MAIFEKYHPILSPRYVMDWLTMATLKDVHTLRADVSQADLSGRTVDASLEQTAHYVNQSMRLVMSNNALLYGITAKASKQFVGSFCLWNFDAEKTQAQIRFELLPAFSHEPIFDEVMPRMVGFAFFELGLNRVFAILPQAATKEIALLTDNHFTQVPETRTRTLKDGSVVPLVRLELARATIEDDPRYRF